MKSWRFAASDHNIVCGSAPFIVAYRLRSVASMWNRCYHAVFVRNPVKIRVALPAADPPDNAYDMP
jgi:hypothetical protein